MKLSFELDGKEYKVPQFINIDNYVKIFKVKGLFDDEYFSAKLVNILTGAPQDKLMEADREKVQYIFNQLYTILPTSKPAFVNKFVLDGVEYGFIPSWKKMSFGEFADLDTLMSKKQSEMLDYLHIITAILYRPITKYHSDHNFEIEKYNQQSLETRAQLFKQKLDIEIALGGQFFFVKFAEIYSNYTPISLKTWMKISWEQIKIMWGLRSWIWKNVVLRKNLDGISFLIEYRKMILRDIRELSKKQLSKSSTNFLI